MKGPERGPDRSERFSAGIGAIPRRVSLHLCFRLSQADKTINNSSLIMNIIRGQVMVEQRLFIMLDGNYSESSEVNMGPLIHRSEEGTKKKLWNVSIIMTINSLFAIFLCGGISFVVLTEHGRWDLVWLFIVPGSISLWIILDWSQYKRVRPVTEIYEKGVLLQKVSWPLHDGYFWPFEELGSVQLKRKIVHLRSKGDRGRANYPLYETGNVGLGIIEKRLEELSSVDVDNPQLRIYGYAEQKQADYQ